MAAYPTWYLLLWLGLAALVALLIGLVLLLISRRM
jgi:hypothetical protein